MKQVNTSYDYQTSFSEGSLSATRIHLSPAIERWSEIKTSLVNYSSEHSKVIREYN